LFWPKYRDIHARCDVAVWDLLSPYDDVLIVLPHYVHIKRELDGSEIDD